MKTLERATLEISATDANEPQRLVAARKSALARFTETGFPTVHDEDWRFTNLNSLQELALKPAARLRPGTVTADMIQLCPFGKLPGNRLVFVNGYFVPGLSSLKTEEGIKLSGLADAISQQSALVSHHLFRAAHAKDTVLASLNTALFKDGAFIYISAAKKVKEPIHLFYLSTEGATAEVSYYPRNLIVTEHGAEVTLTESYFGMGAVPGLTNSVTELIVGENAAVEYVKLQNEETSRFHLSTISAHLGRASRVKIHSMALGAKLSRTNIHATLAGEGLECVLNGLYLTRDEQLADHYMIVDHAAPHCASHEYFNGILAGQSRGVFHGRIIVEPGAQKTDAKQTNKNLLLSDTATINTKPQLEIYADDVKCTHGATIGQLNRDAIFYMRARGIPQEAAKRMLINAFAGEILERVDREPIRDALHKLVWDRLENTPAVLDPNP